MRTRPAQAPDTVDARQLEAALRALRAGRGLQSGAVPDVNRLRATRGLPRISRRTLARALRAAGHERATFPVAPKSGRPSKHLTTADLQAAAARRRRGQTWAETLGHVNQGRLPADRVSIRTLRNRLAAHPFTTAPTTTGEPNGNDPRRAVLRFEEPA